VVFGKDFEHLSGEYVLGHSCIHIQTQGSQYRLKQKVIFDEQSGFPPKWIMVLTGRLCGSLKEIKQSKRYLNTRLQYAGIQQELNRSSYQYRHVFRDFDDDISDMDESEKVKFGVTTTETVHGYEEELPYADSGSTELLVTDIIYPSSRDEFNALKFSGLFSDSYVQLISASKNYFDLYDPPISIRLGTFAGEVMTNFLVSHLMVTKYKLLLTIAYETEEGHDETDVLLQNKYISEEGTLFVPGERWNLSSIARNNNIKWDNSSKPMVRQDGKSHLANVLLLSSPHGRCELKILDEIDKINDGFSKNWRDTGFELGSYEIFGTGGSASTMLIKDNLTTKWSKKQPVLQTAVHQSHNTIENKTLIDICERQGVVAVFVDLDEFGRSHMVTNQTQNRAMFMGYYGLMLTEFGRARKYEWSKGSNPPSKVRRTFPTFLGQPCFRFNLIPLFQPFHWERIINPTHHH
jgi:hypothetical protein